MRDILFHLAQLTTKKANPTPTIIWAAIIGIAAVVVAGMIILQLRKKMLDKQNARDVSGSLMEQLRAMHKRGEVSDAEYEQARKSMASRISQTLDTKRAGGLFELPDPKRRLGGPPLRGGSLGIPTLRDKLSTPSPPDSTPSQQTPLQAPPGYDLTGEPLPKPIDPQ